jgi:hypothetical protein
MRKIGNHDACINSVSDDPSFRLPQRKNSPCRKFRTAIARARGSKRACWQRPSSFPHLPMTPEAPGLDPATHADMPEAIDAEEAAADAAEESLRELAELLVQVKLAYQAVMGDHQAVIEMERIARTQQEEMHRRIQEAELERSVTHSLAA